MDLSFPRPVPAGDSPLPVADMAALVATLSARAGGSVTAGTEESLDEAVPAGAAAEPLLAPATGAFSATMAARLIDWSNA